MKMEIKIAPSAAYFVTSAQASSEGGFGWTPTNYIASLSSFI